MQMKEGRTAEPLEGTVFNSFLSWIRVLVITISTLGLFYALYKAFNDEIQNQRAKPEQQADTSQQSALLTLMRSFFDNDQSTAARAAQNSANAGGLFYLQTPTEDTEQPSEKNELDHLKENQGVSEKNTGSYGTI